MQNQLQRAMCAGCLAVCILVTGVSNAAGTPPVIVGTLYDEMFLPARNADVCFYRADFQPADAAAKQLYPQGAIRCRKTDRSGNYDLSLPDRAPHILLARRKSFWMMRVVTPPPVGDTIHLSDTLRPTGSLQFSVEAEGQANHRSVLGLAGTPFSFTGDSAGTMSIKNVPAGTYAAIIKSMHEGYRAVRCTLRIRAAQTDRFATSLVIPRETAAYVPEKPVVIERSSPVLPPSVKQQQVMPAPKRTTPPSPTIAEAAPTATPPKPAPEKKSFASFTSLPPVVKAPADTFIGIFDSLMLAGTATDNGEIISTEWDIGATGHFIATEDGRIQLPPQKLPRDRLVCLFRAADNDGLSAIDTMVVRIGLLWRTISPPKELLGRNGHSMVVFNDELFIIGGNRSDVWSSRDGISWTMLTDAAPFGKLFGHTTTVFGDRLWIIGGKTGPNTFSNAIWSSATGVRWDRMATMPFDKRIYHASVVFQGRIWVIGGLTDSENEPFRSDVWSSTDGVRWTLAAKQAPFTERYGHGCTAFNDRLIVLGGFNDAVGKPQSFGDAWESVDGSDWRRIADNAPFAREQFHTALSFDNRLWAIGGHNRVDGADRFSDILFTSDGSSWTNLTPGMKGGVRSFCAAVPWRGRILISPSDSHKLWMMR